MKKIILVFVAVFAFAFMANAQSNAIGLRLGGGSYNGGEISYQTAIGSSNRLELDFGFGASKNHTRLYGVAIYQWMWNITDGLNWYAGPGVSGGLYTYEDNDGFFNVAVGGQIGIEYDFNTLGAPLLVSIDARPMWDFLGDNPGLGWGAALGIRYTF